ncbi:MAG: response regulator [Elusimicrobia bacterium]|nr:response regulator [Elusimicrobiota bacterium]
MDGTILLVEDDPEHASLFRYTLTSAGIPNPVHWAKGGQEALDYLARSPAPALVFLDLNLPDLSGFEVLVWARRQRALDGVAIVVLSASHQESTHATAVELGASSYLIKPPDARRLGELMRSLTPA